MRRWILAVVDRMRFQKIRSRFLAAMVILSVSPLFLLGLISYNIAKDTLMDFNTETNQDHLRTSSEVADLMFTNAINLNRSIVLNDTIRDNLKAAQQAAATDGMELRDETVNELQKMINNNFINSRFVDSVCLLDLQYQPYCLGRSDNTGIYRGESKATDIQSSQWYQDATKGNGRVLFFNENVLGDTTDTFSTVKLFRDSSSIEGEPIGMLIVNISTSIFDSFFSGSKKYGGEFVTLDTANGEVQLVNAPRSAQLRPFLEQGSLSQVIDKLDDQGYLTVRYRNETTGWTFMYLLEVRELLKESNQIGTATAMIAVSIAVVALVISYILSGSITKSLLLLKKMMIEWSRGRREFAETFDNDEVGALGETFKKMAVENVELNEKLIHTELREREAELRALQAQIKPHFLYNTLDSIYWMATLKKHEEAAQMTLALSESFKLSLNKGKETILLTKELEHIHHYMTIQNIRYNNRFEYIENVDASMKGMEILKLLLQPLVENAIYHGLEPKVGKGTIVLEGKQEGELVTFVIEDDGVGIADLHDIHDGYGLRNVQERIKMFYGSSSTMQITSEVDKGTRVELKLDSRRNWNA